MTAPDVYLAAARVYWSNYEGLPAEMVEHHAQVTAVHKPFIAAVDAAVRSTQQVGCDVCTDDRVTPWAIAILPPVVLKQAVLTP